MGRARRLHGLEAAGKGLEAAPRMGWRRDAAEHALREGDNSAGTQSSDLSIKQAQDAELAAETSRLPPVPVPAGLGHWRQGEQVCLGSSSCSKRC